MLRAALGEGFLCYMEEHIEILSGLLILFFQFLYL